MLCALPVPFLEFYAVGPLLWLVLFFGGFIVPPLTGIMINSVPPKQKTSANSISNLLQNLLGYLPAPGLYGLVAEMTGGSKSKWPMGMLMYSTIFTVIFFSYGVKKKLANEERAKSRAESVDVVKGSDSKDLLLTNSNEQRNSKQELLIDSNGVTPGSPTRISEEEGLSLNFGL